ncbi:HU family DNA-binding protein [Clostridium perfringens]|uniref:HU family DNA-binding protein n=1 Tax=Clostridium perfringens TaxID=1502 RepID=UPI0022471463|nr:HU family DNA-binding protein [Clostridium perfringens]MCX0396169.1 HU family DNA-binding protein [Clostridium perfringens]
MTKVELIKGLSEEMKISKKEAEAMIGNVDTVIEFLAGQGYSKTKVGKFITAQVIEVPRKEGVCNGKPYVVEPHTEMIIKRTPLLKRI